MNELVEYLSNGDHPVVMERCKTAKELQAMLDRGYALIKFTETKGGTELGFEIDRNLSELDAEFGIPDSSVHLMGELTLNDERVRIVAEIDVNTRKGIGHLEPVMEKINEEPHRAA